MCGSKRFRLTREEQAEETSSPGQQPQARGKSLEKQESRAEWKGIC